MYEQKDDWLLELLKQNANHQNDYAGITLMVKGLVITGLIISQKEYFQIIRENPSTDMKVQDNEAQYKKIVEENIEVTLANAEDTTGYFHLKKAKILTSVGMVPLGNIGLWRGRMSSVDGSMPGRLDIQIEGAKINLR